MTFSINTLGCRLNQYESEALSASFINAGYQRVEEHADIAIVNSCAVTSKSEQKTRRISRMAARSSPLTIVTGCSASVSADTLQALADHIVVVPSNIKEALLELPLYLKDCTGEELYLRARQFIQQYSPDAMGAFAFEMAHTVLKTRASLKIQDGCDYQCSFCLTRIARGKAISLPAETIVERLNKLAAMGHREIVLTGINLALYKDEQIGNLWQLLAYIFANTNGFRLRLSSLEPNAVTEEALPVLKNARLCPYFHLAVQSGSDTVLKNMRRPYKAEEVLKATEILREAKGDPFLSADIIAGFPGESAEDFSQTIALLKQMDITFVHAFAFSPRPQTEAFDLKNKVPERIRDERVTELHQLSKEKLHRYYKKWENKMVEVIVENDYHDGLWRCRSDNYLDLWVENLDETIKPGELVKVRIVMGDRAVALIKEKP